MTLVGGPTTNIQNHMAPNKDWEGKMSPCLSFWISPYMAPFKVGDIRHKRLGGKAHKVLSELKGGIIQFTHSASSQNWNDDIQSSLSLKLSLIHI